MSDRAEYVIHAKLKNNLLLSRILERASTVAEFCAENGVSGSDVGDLINLKKPALLKTGGWTVMALRLAEILGVLPDELFSEEQQTVALKTNVAYMELSRRQIENAIDPLKELENKGVFDEIIKTLTEREKRVMSNIYEHGMTREEIAKQFDVTRSRIMQIEDKALRKLRHPSRRLVLIQQGSVAAEDSLFPQQRRNEDGWTIHEPAEEEQNPAQ